MTCSLLTLRNNQEVIFMKRRHIVLLGILAVLVLAALIYTRPMTLQQIGKVDIAQCESVSGYHRRAPDSEFTSFELSAEDERCSQLIDLFTQQKYRRSLINLLSPGGGSTHQPKDGDFIWDLSFNFRPDRFSRRQHRQRHAHPVQGFLRHPARFHRHRRQNAPLHHKRARGVFAAGL